MSINQHEVFQVTMSQLEKSFQARHIWTPKLVTCEVHELASQVVSEHDEFDQIPVRENGAIVGVLSRDAAVSGQCARECMTPLNDSLLTTADQPLMALLHDLIVSPFYRLVIEGGNIQGIVTRSDVLKLPVRVLAFTLIVHAESLLNERITRCCPDNQSLLSALDPKPRAALKNELDKYVGQRADPPAIELMEFYPKIELAKKLLIVTMDEAEELHRTRKLRNDVDHLHNYAYDIVRLCKFVDDLVLAQKWIDRLTIS